MYRTVLIESIKNNQTEETKAVIGKIDADFLNENNADMLYYAFPLIERILLEIFKLTPGSDVEHIEQGIMKTPIAMLEKNDAINVLPEYILDLIKKYYSDNGIRNNLFHVDVSIDRVPLNAFDEVRILATKTFNILKNKIEETKTKSVIEFIDIERLV